MFMLPDQHPAEAGGDAGTPSNGRCATKTGAVVVRTSYLDRRACLNGSNSECWWPSAPAVRRSRRIPAQSGAADRLTLGRQRRRAYTVEFQVS